MSNVITPDVARQKIRTQQHVDEVVAIMGGGIAFHTVVRWLAGLPVRRQSERGIQEAVAKWMERQP